MIAGVLIGAAIWALLLLAAGVIPLRWVVWPLYFVAGYVLSVLLTFDRRFEEAGDE